MTTSTRSAPYVIVIGNEKGGTGKSTISMHVSIYLMRLGFSVGTLDVDARQGTFTRYFENRKRFATTCGFEEKGVHLPLPEHHPLLPSKLENRKEAENEDLATFETTMAQLKHCDFVLIDTPGNDTNLSRIAHSYADTLITPLNDSFVDLDVLVKIQDLSKNKLSPSTYAETVWEQKKHRLIRDKVTMDWIVLRNRLSTLNAKNKEEMQKVLSLISGRLGFRSIAGFSERVIFRELFLKGITLLDFQDIGEPLKLSHVAARQELRSLMTSINLPLLKGRLAQEDAA